MLTSHYFDVTLVSAMYYKQQSVTRFGTNWTFSSTNSVKKFVYTILEHFSSNDRVLNGRYNVIACRSIQKPPLIPFRSEADWLDIFTSVLVASMRITNGVPQFQGQKFHYPTVSPGDQPLTKSQRKSGLEIAWKSTKILRDPNFLKDHLPPLIELM